MRLSLLLVIVVLLVAFVIAQYNSLVRLRNETKNAWAQVDVVLRRRYDLVPNLVGTVKGYAAHERETLEAVIQARSGAVDASTVADQADSENMLAGALKRLFALSEAYPALKADSNFMELQRELVRTEGLIGYARGSYNESVLAFNNKGQAMTMGDRVAVLKDGVLQQVDTPQNLYDRPCNVFVAAFIGSPSMNLFQASVDGTDLTIGSEVFEIPESVFGQRPALRSLDSTQVIVGIRPEDFADAEFVPDGLAQPRFTTTVSLVESLGSELVVHFSLDAVPVDAGDPDHFDELAGVANCVGRFDRRSRVRRGQHVEVSVAISNLHFFYRSTHESISG